MKRVTFENDVLAFVACSAAVFAFGALVYFAVERPGLALRDSRFASQRS